MRIESDITSLKMVNVIMSVYFIDLRIKTCELLVILAGSVLVLQSMLHIFLVICHLAHATKR